MSNKCKICGKNIAGKGLTCSEKCRKKRQKNYGRKYYKQKANYLRQQIYMKNYYQNNKIKYKIVANQHKKHYDYNKFHKNRIRENIVNILNYYNINFVLTLESEKFLFSRMIPYKTIFVYENNYNIYKRMLINKPVNVDLFFSNISSFNRLPINVDFIYLDFCCNLNSAKQYIVSLKEKINKCKIFAITICPRDYKPIIGDYQFDLITQLQRLTNINWKVIYGEAYCDSMPMLTVLLENPLE